EKLSLTQYTQPAVLTTSVAICRLVSQVITPDAVAGHSLGEYSALVSAGSLTLDDAVRVTRRRALLMEEAVAAGKGGMAAIIGLSAAAVADLCRQVAGLGVVEPATLNGGGQVVIAGEMPALEQAMSLAATAGARR